MTKQWHSTRIEQKPFSRYNPSLKNKVSSAYRPWFIVVALFCIIIGIGIIGCASAMKQYDTDIKDELFHLWVGIPLLVCGIVALIPFALRDKKIVVFFLVIAFLTMVICATGSVITGLRYWMDGWQQTKRDIDDNKCSLKSNICVCSNGLVNMPSKIDSCDDLEILVILLITQIGLCAGGFIFATCGLYLSFMAVCCAPWMYTEWYDEQYDPDFNDGKAPVRHTGNVNVAYGNHH